MKFIKYLIIPVVMLIFALPVQAGESVDLKPLRAMTKRLLPRHHAKIHYSYQELPAEEFILRAKDGEVEIAGNSTISMAFALNHYLKHYCNQTVTWYLKDRIQEPKQLPATDGEVRRKALVKDRFFLNYCTYGYSLNWWQWEEWEHLIDWMALNGVNMALATTAQESIWQRVWRQFGLTDEEIRSYFTGPSYLAWHRMANIDAWHSPLPQSWIDGQLKLQKRIIDRERELGIMPIFTSFTGHVPKALMRLHPEAEISKLNPWTGFEEAYNSYYLNPGDPLFEQIQTAFMQQQRAAFGSSNVYGVDPFNELDPPSWDPDYLARASKLIYESITRFDPQAVWLQMAWVFYHKRKDWTPERLKAYLTAVPQDKMLMLDYYCDKIELWRQTDSFYGQPFIWSYLGNFGGNTMIAGNLKDVSQKIEAAYAHAGTNFTGLGCTLEGLDVNPMMYEYVLDRAWSRMLSDEEWIDNLADRHLGFADPEFRKAWQLLYDKVYCEESGNRAAALCGRPNLTGRSKWNNTRICYKNTDLLSAWEAMMNSPRSNASAYRFDCVNIARQCLENYFGALYLQSLKAYEQGEKEQLELLARKMLTLIDDLDRLVATDSYFLLGQWIDDARRWGTTKTEKAYYERDARNILTTWGGRGYRLNDYANRSWSGLLATYYKPRWEAFYRELTAALDAKQPFDQTAFDERMFDFEWAWNARTEQYARKPIGDFWAISHELYARYASEIRQID